MAKPKIQEITFQELRVKKFYLVQSADGKAMVRCDYQLVSSDGMALSKSVHLPGLVDEGLQGKILNAVLELEGMLDD